MATGQALVPTHHGHLVMTSGPQLSLAHRHENVCRREVCMAVFGFPAFLVADSAWAEVASVCESAKTNVWDGYIPCHGFSSGPYGSNITPSGLLLSLVVRPRGSFVEGT